MLGVIYHDQGQYQKALRAFEAALRINPGYTDAALNLAVTYNDTGKYKEAQETYRHALSRSGARQGKLDRFVQGKLANMYADIGDVYLSSGLYQEAIAEYRRALELGPGFVDIRARARRRAARRGRARRRPSQEYEEVVRQSPTYVPARLNLGLSLLRGRAARTRRSKQWKAVLEISPGQPERRAVPPARGHPLVVRAPRIAAAGRYRYGRRMTEPEKKVRLTAFSHGAG